MARAESFQDLSLTPQMDDRQRWRWLCDELRRAILDGRLRAGARLPSTRNLSRQYGLSRGTVVAAFDQLAAEGYTRSEVGAGTFVAFRVPEAVPAQPGRARLSRRAEAYLPSVTVIPAPRTLGGAFRAFEPAIEQFPAELWARVAARVLRRAPRMLYGHGAAAGYMPLRRAIADYLGSSRGVRCQPEQVLVTSGAQQALDLISRLLVDPDDAVWIEDPGYSGAAETLRCAGARLVPVPVDSEGINVRAGRNLADHARLAYVTPANQFPLGHTLSAARRAELLDWATESGAWIVEDDYDAEYRYSGHPISSLQSMDTSGSVLYVGTFTKLLFNALRIGYVVLPERLVESFSATRSFVDRHPPTLEQAILAEFILEGHFGQHVRKMRQLYGERAAALSCSAEKHLYGLLRVDRAEAGMRTLGWLADGSEDRQVAQSAIAAGIEVIPLSQFTFTHRQPPALMLGFATTDEAAIDDGCQRLATVLSAVEGRVALD